MSELKTKPVFVVWTNSDLTEGRGRQIPISVCEHEATARRLCKRQGVQGSDATVQECEAIWHQGGWAAPVQIVPPSKEDIAAQERIDAGKALIAKARAMGLSDDEIKQLKAIP